MQERRVIVGARELTKIYGTTAPVTALDHVNLDILEGEMVAVMGPSGCGKSTLLNMLGALDRPTSGAALIDGQDLAKVRDIDRFRARTLGFVFQMHNLIPTLTALENVEVPLRGQGLGAGKRRGRARDMLALVGLADRQNHLPSQLSGGERQRVAIARALVNEPSLVLADEPTGNLDSASGEELIALLTRLNRERRTTILIVTHDRSVSRTTQRILQMRDGRIVQEHVVRDPLTEDLRALAQSPFGQMLLAGKADALHGFPLVEDGALNEMARQLAEMLRPLAS
jgi:ABC-type lipoprotein export system ATPase subunit